jgi:hypothetical protein
MGLFDSSNGGNQQLAVDWEAKTIPLLTYKNVLNEQHECIRSYHKMTSVPIDMALYNYAASLYTFYQTVITEFSEWLIKEYSKPEFLKEHPQFFHESKQITEEDYDKVIYLSNLSLAKLNVMFRIIKFWCDTNGPFRTYMTKHNPHTAILTD